MSDTTNRIQVGPGFCGTLTIVFLVLKLCGVIAWSWWWVFAPLWIPLCVGLAIVAVVLCLAGLAAIAER